MKLNLIKRIFKNRTVPQNTTHSNIVKKWKSLVPEHPTLNEVSESWKYIFDYYPNECDIEGYESGVNTGFIVKTPWGIHHHAGFGDHMENPSLKNKEEIFYENCGCDWGVDLNGNRYYKVDKSTGLPVNFERAKSIEIIRRFIGDNSENIKMLLKS